MIDTYFDRVDAATGYRAKKSAPVWDHPYYFRGIIYDSSIARDAAEATYNVDYAIHLSARAHMYEIKKGIAINSPKSIFRNRMIVRSK